MGFLMKTSNAVSVYVTKSVPEEEDDPWNRASLALSIIAVVISLTALMMWGKGMRV
jgi:hypothetical protein